VNLDSYTIRARVLPGVLTALPVIMLAALGITSLMAGVIPAISGVALAFLLAELVRRRGQKLETRLKQKWGGFPTTYMLRFDSRVPDARLTERRNALESVTGAELPARALEDSNLAAANIEIERVVRLGIARVRDAGVEASLLQQENTSYGFRRNLRSLTPFGLIAVLASAVVASFFLESHPAVVVTIYAIDALVAAAWILLIKDEWVHDQAKKYAERFFVAIETIAQKTPANDR
jgi:hypothetical protein